MQESEGCGGKKALVEATNAIARLGTFFKNDGRCERREDEGSVCARRSPRALALGHNAPAAVSPDASAFRESALASSPIRETQVPLNAGRPRRAAAAPRRVAGEKRGGEGGDLAGKSLGGAALARLPCAASDHPSTACKRDCPSRRVSTASRFRDHQKRRRILATCASVAARLRPHARTDRLVTVRREEDYGCVLGLKGDARAPRKILSATVGSCSHRLQDEQKLLMPGKFKWSVLRPGAGGANRPRIGGAMRL